MIAWCIIALGSFGAAVGRARLIPSFVPQSTINWENNGSTLEWSDGGDQVHWE